MEETRQGQQQAGVESMHRGGPGRVVLGVCKALSRQLGLDVALVRIAFVLALAVTGGTALFIYMLVWGLTPATAHGRAPVQRVLRWLSRLVSATEESRWERKV